MAASESTPTGPHNKIVFKPHVSTVTGAVEKIGHESQGIIDRVRLTQGAQAYRKLRPQPGREITALQQNGPQQEMLVNTVESNIL